MLREAIMACTICEISEIENKYTNFSLGFKVTYLNAFRMVSTDRNM
jgi:hypothetical protein